ncbi:hypothetical protein JHK85_030402 [Glycine max]|nr:hypothetical protein JHK85_030402 [Glycine max]
MDGSSDCSKTSRTPCQRANLSLPYLINVSISVLLSFQHILIPNPLRTQPPSLSVRTFPARLAGHSLGFAGAQSYQRTAVRKSFFIYYFVHVETAAFGCGGEESGESGSEICETELQNPRTERGTYYALHLGGTNFRVLRVQLNGQPSSDFEHEVERQPIPQHVMTSTSEVGRDVAACLQEALTRKGLDMRVAALVRKYFHLPTVILSPHHSILTQLGLSIVCFKVTTPLMSAMHEDNSPDLREVARILNDIFEPQSIPVLLFFL